MKKFFAVLLVILAGAMPLRADDTADVKAVILKEWELIAKGDFVGVLPLLTKDYRGLGRFNYEQTKWMFIGLDGKHLEEFVLFTAVAFKNGETLTPEELEKCRADARDMLSDPMVVKAYEAEAKKYSAKMREWAAFTLKHHKFVSVKVDGDSAVAEIVLESKPGEPPRRSRPIVIRLRRLDGAWRISEDVEI
jgi:hypothetical protein